MILPLGVDLRNVLRMKNKHNDYGIINQKNNYKCKFIYRCISLIYYIRHVERNFIYFFKCVLDTRYIVNPYIGE